MFFLPNILYLSWVYLVTLRTLDTLVTGSFFLNRSSDDGFMAAGNFSVPTATAAMALPGCPLPGPAMPSQSLQPSPSSPFHISMSKLHKQQLAGHKLNKPVLSSLGSSVVSSTPSSTSSSCSSRYSFWVDVTI